jgi:hypothetical protein
VLLQLHYKFDDHHIMVDFLVLLIPFVSSY